MMTSPHRMTKQRQAVIEELARVNDRFRSAQQIFEDLQKSGERVGLATVYRNLQSLADANYVSVMRSEEGESLYQSCLTKGHHHHLVCRSCGVTEEINADQVEAWVNHVAQTHSFTQIEHNVELFGLCPTCTENLATA